MTSLKGQDRVVNLLRNYVKSGKIPHAYLFLGPEGVGKSSTAKFFAKLLNCQSDSQEACGRCAACKKIEDNIHPDVRWIGVDESSSIKIAHIRGLEKEIYLKPYEAKRKVFIIPDAQFLTEEAANCLLKTLEEPPGSSIIILTSVSLQLVFKTISSRCQRILFSTIDSHRLDSILQKDYNVDSKTGSYLASFFEGRIGRAIAKSENKSILDEKNDIIDSFLSGNMKEGVFSSRYREKDNIKEDLNIIISWLRDIILLKAGVTQENIVHADRVRDLQELKDKFSTKELTSVIDSVLDIYGLLDKNLKEQIFLEYLKEKLWKK